MSMINATERATNPPTTAQAAGRAKSECLERKIIQWEKMKHAAMNASKAAENPIALPSVFGTYLSMLPVKSACIGSMSGMCGYSASPAQTVPKIIGT